MFDWVACCIAKQGLWRNLPNIRSQLALVWDQGNDHMLGSHSCRVDFIQSPIPSTPRLATAKVAATPSEQER